MLKSLHIIGSRQMGGAESFFLRLLKGLNQGDHRAAAVVRPCSPLKAVLKDVATIHPIPMRNGWDLFSVAAIRKLVRVTGVEIVQSYMGRASRLTRLPQDAKTVHVARLGGFYKIDGYYRHADAWVGNTRALCDYLVEQGLPADRVYHIGNFVDDPYPAAPVIIQDLREQLAIPDEAFVIFSLGRFIDIKGFDDLLKAFSRLPDTIHGRPLRLVIGGDGPLREAHHRLADELGVSDRVCWAGWLKIPGPYFHLADLFVVPSTHETLGNVILEAWSYALPVISTRTPGALELISDGEDGVLVPCRDTERMAEVLRELISGPSVDLARLGATGQGVLIKKHSRSAVIRAYLDMYEELCR